MAVEYLKSTAVSNADGTPVVFNNGRVVRMPLWEFVGTKTVSASASIGSTYRLGRVPSNARISEISLSCSAFDTTGAADIGVYQTAYNGGTVVDADFFGSAVVLTTALTNSNVTHESGVFGISDVEKPLWEALGLSADPMRDYDIALTLTAANGAGATPVISMRTRFGI